MIAWQGNEGFKQMNRWGAEKTPFLAIISYDKQNILLEKLDAISPEICQYAFPDRSNALKQASGNAPKLDAFDIDAESYKKSFDKVMSHINNGDTYLCNLSCEVKLKNQLDLPSVFNASFSKYKLRYKDEFVCFSPEIFIRIKGNEISTYPMKGTIDARILNAEECLLNDKKELAEHYTITDLLRNDLSRLSDSVRVKRFRYIDRIKTSSGELLQTSSEIIGTLNENWHCSIGDMLNKILPAGSITGAPKKRTCEVIEEAETHKRGFYTGVCVLFDGENVDSFVMIRMIVRKNKNFYYKSGGGVTSFSQWEKELNEIKQKVYVPIS